jgi:hypothetical protein
MTALEDLRIEANNVNETNQIIIEEFQFKLGEKMVEVNGKIEQFWKYKKSVAIASQNSRTGKPIPQKILDQLEIMERKKDTEIAEVRLENIKLRNKLKRHEQLLRQKVISLIKIGGIGGWFTLDRF